MLRLRVMLIALALALTSACTLSQPTPFPVNTVGPPPTQPTTVPEQTESSPQPTNSAPSTLPAPDSPVQPTFTLPSPATSPSTVGISNRELALDPILRVENGAYVLEAGTTVAVRWGGAPSVGRFRFILSNRNVDGGVTVLSDGAPTVASFNVPENLNGELTATAILPDGSEIGANPVRVVAESNLTGECRYIPAALGTGEVLYADADVNSTELGRVDPAAEFLHLTSREGPGSRDETVIFHQIMNVTTGQSGWVLASVGGRLAGDCTL